MKVNNNLPKEKPACLGRDAESDSASAADVSNSDSELAMFCSLTDPGNDSGALTLLTHSEYGLFRAESQR